MRLAARLTTAAHEAGLEVRGDPDDAGLFRLYEDVPTAELAHTIGAAGGCSRCGRSRLSVAADALAVPERTCAAVGTVRRIGLVVVRDERVTYAELHRQVLTGLASSIETTHVLDRIRRHRT